MQSTKIHSPSQISKDESKSVCICVVWNRNDTLADSDFLMIEMLRTSFDELLVVQNINKVAKTTPMDFENVSFLNRPNKGYDFGGYKFGITVAKNRFAKISELVICNNSIVPISNDLNPTLNLCRKSPYDVTGLTDSYEVAWHIQSYFIHFKEEVLNSGLFDSWWTKLNLSNKKSETVKLLEIPLAGHFSQEDFCVGAIWNQLKVQRFSCSSVGIAFLGSRIARNGFQELFARVNSGRSINSTHFMWQQLLELGFPFVKKDLISGRVSKDLAHDDWKNFIKSISF